jgi:tetratricopeptide (TPR) repeat protein
MFGQSHLKTVVRQKAPAGALWLSALVFGLLLLPSSRAAEEPGPDHPILVLELEGRVDVMRAGARVWDPAYTNQVLEAGDQLRTLQRSRAVIRLSDLTLMRLGESSSIRIPPPKREGAFYNLLRGVLYFFHRDHPGEFDIDTPQVSAVVRGTEFNLRVGEDGATTLTLFDGEVEMTNRFGRLSLVGGQEGEARPDQPPRRTPGLATVNQVQWCLYYPGILDADELNLDEEARRALEASLRAYRAGDLLQALQAYPTNRQPSSPEESLYRAALLLAVGNVAETQTLLEDTAPGIAKESRAFKFIQALRQLIASVVPESFSRPAPPDLASEWMAESYYRQSRSELEAALAAARRATEIDPRFGFAWERRAELEFSFGNVPEAEKDVERSLELAPRNAQAEALKGFLLSAQNQIREAQTRFDRAIALDGALGNAWLGRGLCKIRRGQTQAGLADIQVAATLEPQRAALRHYLGKAYGNRGEEARAARELDLAKKLDPEDPTAWLYSALVRQQQNRINQAVADLELSQELNDNRSVYRSRLLLDQDRAVRGANLANVYADAGLEEVSVREAARSVNADYANFSGHLFLANSYSRLQDPGRVNLRFETAAVSEYLLANLLAPVGAGALSPTVSQQEYSKLFSGDGLGVVSDTEYLSRGAWTENGAFYGTYGNTGFALDSLYVSDNGQRRNNGLELTSLSFQLKEQISARDTAFAQVLWSGSESGDTAPRYDPDQANPDVRVKERQEPILIAGYNHEWSPGNHTLVLAGRLHDRLDVNDPFQNTALIAKDDGGNVLAARDITIGQDYESELEIYTLEAQQIFQRSGHTLVAGSRCQFGTFDNFNRHSPNGGSFFSPGFFTNLAGRFDSDFQRVNAYACWQWQIIDPRLLVAGLSYDWMKRPVNFRFAPLTDGESTVDQFSPKAGLIWTPAEPTTIRAAYTRSLGGVSFDQSFRLEPSQVAGINQAFRSVIPDAVAGANAAEAFDHYSVAFDQKLPTRAYLGLNLELLKSDVDRDVGVYDALPPPTGVFPIPPFVYPSQTRQSLDYEEKSLAVTLNQLVGETWTFGAGYRLSYAQLDVRYRDVPLNAPAFNGFDPKQNFEAWLHQVKLFALYNHPSGFFAEGQACWFQQSNQGYSPDIPGDDFWQLNAFAGYRFFRRRAEISLGLLNITDQDYRLNPLNVTAALPRDRTLAARFRFNF